MYVVHISFHQECNFMYMYNLITIGSKQVNGISQYNRAYLTPDPTDIKINTVLQVDLR